MFDDQVSNPNNLPSNLPTEPVDMFAEVDKDGGNAAVGKEGAQITAEPPNALEAGRLKKKEDTVPAPDATVPEGQASAPPTMPAYAMKEPILGKILMFVIFAVILGGLGFGGWWVYANFMSPAVKDNNAVVDAVKNNNDSSDSVESESKPSESKPIVENPAISDVNSGAIGDVGTKMNNDQILFGEPIDSDKDGLDDVREKEIATDPNNSDTDKDGLIDGDEVIIWKTNPLNPDSDSDSHQDGKEVRNGYNPLGPGKLFDVQPASSTSDSSLEKASATTTATATQKTNDKTTKK